MLIVQKGQSNRRLPCFPQITSRACPLLGNKSAQGQPYRVWAGDLLPPAESRPAQRDGGWLLPGCARHHLGGDAASCPRVAPVTSFLSGL